MADTTPRKRFSSTLGVMGTPGKRGPSTPIPTRRMLDKPQIGSPGNLFRSSTSVDRTMSGGRVRHAFTPRVSSTLRLGLTRSSPTTSLVNVPDGSRQTTLSRTPDPAPASSSWTLPKSQNVVSFFQQTIPEPPAALDGAALMQRIPDDAQRSGSVYADDFLAHTCPPGLDDSGRRQWFCILDLRRLKYAANELFAKKDWRLNISNFAKEYEKSRSLIMLHYGLYEFQSVQPSAAQISRWRKENNIPEPEDDSPARRALAGVYKRKAEEGVSSDDDAELDTNKKRRTLLPKQSSPTQPQVGDENVKKESLMPTGTSRSGSSQALSAFQRAASNHKEAALSKDESTVAPPTKSLFGSSSVATDVATSTTNTSRDVNSEDRTSTVFHSSVAAGVQPTDSAGEQDSSSAKPSSSVFRSPTTKPSFGSFGKAAAAAEPTTNSESSSSAAHAGPFSASLFKAAPSSQAPSSSGHPALKDDAKSTSVPEDTKPEPTIPSQVPSSLGASTANVISPAAVTFNSQPAPTISGESSALAQPGNESSASVKTSDENPLFVKPDIKNSLFAKPANESSLFVNSGTDSSAFAKTGEESSIFVKPDVKTSLFAKQGDASSALAKPGAESSLFANPDVKSSLFAKPSNEISALAKPGDESSLFANPGVKSSVFATPGDDSSALAKSGAESSAFAKPGSTLFGMQTKTSFASLGSNATTTAGESTAMSSSTLSFGNTGPSSFSPFGPASSSQPRLTFGQPEPQPEDKSTSMFDVAKTETTNKPEVSSIFSAPKSTPSSTTFGFGFGAPASNPPPVISSNLFGQGTSDTSQPPPGSSFTFSAAVPLQNPFSSQLSSSNPGFAANPFSFQSNTSFDSSTTAAPTSAIGEAPDFSFGGNTANASNLFAPQPGAASTGPSSRPSFGGFTQFSPATAKSEATKDIPTTKHDKQDDDPEGGAEVQVNLTVGGAGEENETIVYEVRCKALKQEPKQTAASNKSQEDTIESNLDYVTKGVGPLRVLKHKTTGAKRLVLRAEPRGNLVLNHMPVPGMRYVANKKFVIAPFPGEQQKLDKWLLMVKTAVLADELAAAINEQNDETMGK